MSEKVGLEVIATMDVSGVKKGATDARKELASTAAAAQKLDSSLAGSAKGTNQAGQALTNLGRVAQDAPFGFVGIQNNLNPLLESFQRLKAETGSSASALKALGSSLIGPAGVGFALSAVSALFLAFGPAIKDFINSTSAAEKAQQELNNAFIEAESSVAGNVSRLQALVAIAKDVNQSDNARKEALGALNKEYDGFNGKLTLANINTQESIALIDRQTQAIIRQSKIKAVQGLIDKETENQLKIQRRDIEDNLSLYQKAKTLLLTGTSGAQAGALIVEGLKEQDKQLKVSEATLTEYTNLLKELLTEDATSGTLFKEKNAKESVKNVLTISDVLQKLSLELTVLNAKEINLKTNESRGKITAIQNAIDDLITKLKVASDSKLVLKLFGDIKDIQFVQKLKENLQTSVGKLDIKAAPILTIAPVIKESGWIKELTDKLKEDAKIAADNLVTFKDIISTTVTDVFSNLGESIGKAIGGGGFGDIFKGIFSALGAGLKKLGIFAIVTSKLIDKLKKTILAAPQLGVIAGIALIALGTLIQSQISNTKAFATGVRNFTGGLALVGERGPELVNLPQGSSVTTNGQLNAGKGQNNIYIPEVKISGQDILLIFNRAQTYASRNF